MSEEKRPAPPPETDGGGPDVATDPIPQREDSLPSTEEIGDAADEALKPFTEPASEGDTT